MTMARHLERDHRRRRVFAVDMGSARTLARVAHPRRAGRGRRAVAAALALALALPASAAGAARTLLIEGAGDGHGVGMSQDGALGLARHGFSYQSILAHYYSGTTLGTAPPKTVVKVLVGNKVLRLGLERYVRGVVAAEVPASWPMAALEAQAVASRTYALTSHAGGSRFDVYADTRSQVYLGRAAETTRTNQAIAATAGQVVLYAGKPATTYFFASSGGMTESIQNSFLGAAPEPWLIGVADPYEDRAAAAWRTSLSWSAASRHLRGLVQGSLRGIEVLRRGVSPRIVAALVLGSRGNTPVSGPELAARFGLGSTWAYFSVRTGGKVVRGPDVSRSSPAPQAPPAPQPVGSQGGAPAPAPAVSAGATGGVPAR
jgi:SpoIID/LytB domain protein